ncbi:MAG: hypothetical protein QOJ27_191 [Sphingomonadales bacterium]|nr:hypothetical protein [Sphingomonadales bacterium]
MPLHISEIGVHMAVRDPEQGPSGPSGAGAGGCGSQPGGMTPAQRDNMVDDCVRAVLRELRMSEAR